MIVVETERQIVEIGVTNDGRIDLITHRATDSGAYDDLSAQLSQVDAGRLVDALLTAGARSAPLAPAASQAIRDIIAERARQIRKEGWTPEHDDLHTDGALARAAAAYAVVGSLGDRFRACLYPSSWGAVIRSLWPASWDETWFKPKDRRHDLVRSGALIAAEIERLDRAEAAAS